MKRALERHAARMRIQNAALNFRTINRMPRRTPEEIRRQRDRRNALYETVYQARQLLARKPGPEETRRPGPERTLLNAAERPFR